MKDRRARVHWLACQPTPYNDVLFSSLGRDPDLDLTVHYRVARRATHPWQSPLGQGYPARICRGARSLFSIDLHFLSLILSEPGSVFALSGWSGMTGKLALVLLALKRRSFLFWTDTPKIRYANSQLGSHRVIEYADDVSAYTKALSVMRRTLYSLVFANAKAVMSTGKPGVQALIALGCPPQKATNLPFFVDLPSIAGHRKRDDESGKQSVFTFISCGQLTRRKGYDLAIKALGIARKASDSPFRYLIAGEGPERRALEELSLSSGLRNEVEFLGWQEPDQVRSLLARSDAFVHPARLDPFPVAVLEAMAAGLPVLGSDVSGSVVDRVEHGRSGFIHPVGDFGTLASHMTRLLAEPDLAAQLGRIAREKAEEWPVERGLAVLRSACGLGA